MPITLNHSNISIQYSTGSNYIIETVKSDLYRRNELIDTIVRDNIQVAPVTPSMYIENGTNNIYAVESYTYSGSANTADFTRVFTKSTTCDILIIGGGGGGGYSNGGGGGAGQLVLIHQATLNGQYTIKVGKGGIGGISPTKGIDSEFGTVIAEGGGANGGTLKDGGSGAGGDGYSPDGGTTGAGNKNTTIDTFPGATVYSRGNNGGNNGGTGGYQGGGGGGAGEAGTIGQDISPFGKGGDGLSGISAINYDFKTNFGTNIGKIESDGLVWFAGGGGGGGNFAGLNGGKGGGGAGTGPGPGNTPITGVTGLNGTGSGGGGGSGYGGSGGAGGSGIVIIRYLLGTIPGNNLLTNEPVVVAPTFTETTRTFVHSGGAETQTTYTITVGRDTICDILIVGGGGGGGKFGGGAGAGAILFANNLLLNTGSYSIKVGKGGTGSNTDTANGTNGIDSSILINAIEYIAKGGGGGGSRQTPAANYAGRNGNDGGSGGGGSQADKSPQALGGSSNKNTYTNWLSYGNNGGTGKLYTTGAEPTRNSGGGGGAGSIGANISSTGGGNGGTGISFVSTFGTSVGHSGWFGGGGGGNTYSGAGNPGYGNGGNGLLGGGGNGGFDGGSTLAAQDGLPNTGGGGGGSKDVGGTAEEVNGGHGGSGIVIIKFKSTTPILEGITHKRLNFTFDRFGYSFDATKSVEYQAQLKTGVGGWRIVRFLPPNLGRWYQGNYINTSTFTIPTIGTPYNYTNEWAVPFGTFDEMFFATFDMTYWLHCLKSAVLGSYTNTARPIIRSSSSSIAYSANWYNRSANTEDPWISIGNYPTQVVYGENSTTFNSELINAYGGMCVLVRDSTASTTIPNPNTYSLNFQVPTIADINNNSNIVLRGVYDIALSTSNAVIIPKASQYIPPPTTFTNYDVERMYPPVRNFLAATTTVSGQTYGNGTYVVSYSSTYSVSGNPWTCFNSSDTGGGHWAIDRYTSGVFNSTSFIVSGYLGDWLNIQLPVAIKLTRFSFVTRPTFDFRAPKDFKIYGSNDGITWDELVNKTNAIYYSSTYQQSTPTYQQSTPEITRAYSFYALVVNKIFSTGTVLNFDEWYIHGQEPLTNSLSIRYNLLNPILDPIGAQWTYSSNNTNVYHMGRVGIGTTNPEYQLDVRGFIFTSAGGYTQTGSENWVVQSDRRIKENIVKASYEKCLDNVKKIELYNFNFKDNCVNTNDKNQLGFIAQEVQQVYPKAVEVGRMTLDNNQEINDLLTLNTTQIKYTLYGAVKNLIERVENIESRVEQLYNMTLSSNIKSSTSNISITFITPLTPNITTNTSNIITNSSNITTNSSNISTNTSNITANSSNITANTSNITANTSNITTNTSNISTNTSNITANTSNIDTSDMNTSNMNTSNTDTSDMNTSNLDTSDMNTSNIDKKIQEL
jgi:hypothetical protein